MRWLILIALLGGAFVAWAQDAKPAAKSQTPATASKPGSSLAPPRSDSVHADTMPLEPGNSSSKDTQVDLSPPEDDVRAHPHSAEILMDEGSGSGDSDSTSEFHAWDPHKAAKDVEVGDYYFKRKNYKGAEDRYREALYYKENDAVATFRLGVCLEKMGRSDDARTQYENYLKILPHGPEAEEAKKSVERLKGASAPTSTK